MLSTLSIGCDRGVTRTDRDTASCAGGCNNREGRGKGCDRRIDRVEWGGVVLLIAAANQSCAVGLHRIQLPNRIAIVALSEAETDEAAIVCRSRGGEILAERSARGR